MKNWMMLVLASVVQMQVATVYAQADENVVNANPAAPGQPAAADAPETLQAPPSGVPVAVPVQAAIVPVLPPQRYPHFASVQKTPPEPQPEVPRDTRFFLAFVVQNARLLDKDAQLFSKDQNVSGAGLVVLARIRELAPKWMVSAGADWQHLETDGAWTFGSTSTRSNTFAATAVLRYEHSWWLRPFARLALGGRNNHFSMLGVSPSYSDSAWAPFGSVSAGFGIMSAPKGGMPVGLSFDLEGGLSGSGAVSVAPKAGGSQKDGIIPVSGPGIGKQGGLEPMLRLVFGLHF
jgi:hypothetical protein